MFYLFIKRRKPLIFLSTAVAAFAMALLVAVLVNPNIIEPSPVNAENIDTEKNSVPPTITLTGEKLYILNYGETFNEPGFSAQDDIDGDLTYNVKISSTLADYKAGTHIITYSVKDSSGNTASTERHVLIKSEPSKDSVPLKAVYLTFDDGPSIHTEKILDVLSKYNVKATFFVTGQKPQYFDVMKSITDDGHTIAIHTYSHVYDIYNSTDAYLTDFNKISDLIYKNTGTYTSIFRFPGGSSNVISKKHSEGIMTELSEILTKKGYEYFDWNVDSADTVTKNPEKIAKNVISSLKSGRSIVLMHDIKEATITALPIIIEYCQQNGYTFLPLTDTTAPYHHKINN